VKVLFDHNTPWTLAKYLTGHTVAAADHEGWARLQNGDLIAAAEAAGFEVMISGDKNLEYQQRVHGRKVHSLQLIGP
jgi:predicted nuclease of predicted toxin-antitoxin system